MKATWFENRELITLYTNPAYFGADVPKSYAKRPSKPVPVDSLFGYEPPSKMTDIHHKNSVLKMALKMKTGTWGGKPIVVRKDPKGYQVLDGHHRMHAARKAGLETLPAVIVGAEDIEYSDEVKEQRINESIDPVNNIRQAMELERRAEEIWKRSVGRQFQWKSSAKKLRQIGKVIQVGQDPKKFIRDLNNFYNQYVSFIQKNKLPTEVIRLLKQIQKLLVDLNKNLAEASGYIPTVAQANDPRFKTALTVDVRPGEDQRNIEKLGLNLNMDLVNKTKPGRKYKKRTLKEAPKDWGDMKLDGDKTQQSIDYFYTDHAPNKIGNRRDAGNFKGFNVVTFTKGADTLMFLVDNKDRAVFYVAFTNMKDGVAIGNVRSNGTVRATEVYAFLVDKFKTLYSDKHQTPQGRKIWTDFAKFFPNIKVTDTGERLKATTLEESLMERYQAIKEEDLVEVEMSSSALRSWAKSELAQGVRAGFELELILPDTEKLDDDQYDNEADMDADEPIGTLDQIVDFYNGPDNMSWETEQRTTEDQFRESVIEDLMDYEMEVFQDEWGDVGYEKVREEMIDQELNTFRDDNMDEIAQDAFDKDYDDLSANEEAYVDQKIMEQFEEEIKNEFENQGDTYNRVYEEAMEESRGNITWNQFWEAKQIESMGDLLNVYDLYFPYVQGAGGGSKEIGQWADEISEITGKGTNVSYQYHGSDKEAGKYTIEPDSSLTADDEFDAGIELVSPVMPLDEAVEQLEKLMLWAEDNAYTNSSTGLHMNISVPQGNEIDYTKLVLFSGDKYILDKYERLGNSYADSALGQLEARAGSMDANRAAEAMQKMKTNLEDAAEEYVRAGTGQAKYTSIHIKDGYIEFRGPGGQYTAQEVDQVMDTMLRFARAMTIAADPQAYRQEYQKKLYKILSKGGQQERTIDSLFADFQAGNINKEIFKKRWANLVVKQQQDQAVLNRLDDKPDNKRLAKAKQLQKDLGGPVKPWKYTMQYTTADGTEKTMER